MLGRNKGVDKQCGLNRLNSAATGKDYFDMLKIEKVIFKNEVTNLKHAD